MTIVNRIKNRSAGETRLYNRLITDFCMLVYVSLKPAAHERTCRAYLLFVTSWIDKISSCAGNIYGIFVIRDM